MPDVLYNACTEIQHLLYFIYNVISAFIYISLAKAIVFGGKWKYKTIYEFE